MKAALRIVLFATSEDSSSRIAELDSVRAVAIFAVLCHHYLIGFVPGLGWMGVDLFFVLSGYFITTILLSTRGEQNFYSHFYISRALRILPLYYLVVGGILLYSRFTGSGSAYEELRGWGSTLWVWLLAGNIRAAARNAFPPNSSLALLWSVQVEEQFYILYPLLIAMIPPKRLRTALFAAIVTALALRVALAITVPGHWWLQFVLMPSRMDDLAMGALIASYFRTSTWPLRSAATLSLAALGALLVSAIVYFAGPSWQSSFVGTIGFTAIGLTCMLIISWILLNAGKPAAKLLRCRPVCWIGRISYGIYMLHGPIAYLIKSEGMRLGYANFDKTPLSAITYTLVTIAFAAVSYRWIEQPILKSRELFIRCFHR
jgi:peptidoglycan/LPS O-acetylase OafA/YrhL